jgi:riboflavin kinase/FMN adenylyltransferase
MHTFSGKVIHGHKRGRLLNFPTANVPLLVAISEGIYISETSIDVQKYPSLTFIGAAKTFDEHTYQSETYILKFDQDIYEREISVTLLEKLRGNIKFDSQEELITQMEKDKKDAETYFSKEK